jgi:hypothetical protein
MSREHTNAARRSAHSKVSLPNSVVGATGRVNCAEFGSSKPALYRAIDFIDDAPTQPLFEAIEDQRLSLLNVLGIVHCISVGVSNGDENPVPEISTAFELLEREIERIAAVLEKISLRSVTRDLHNHHAPAPASL